MAKTVRVQAERTGVIHGPDKVREVLLGLFSGARTRLDFCASEPEHAAGLWGIERGVPDAAVNAGTIKPDVVIMDYRLPGMDGIRAAKELLRKVPETKAVITTADDTIRAKAEASGLYFLQKPFSTSTLPAFLARI